MDHENRSLRVGAAVIACALVLRLGAGGFFLPVVRFLSQPNITSLLIYLETGRIVRFSDSSGDSTPFAIPPTQAPTETATQPPALPVFSAADAALVEFYGAELTADPGTLLEQPLQWELKGDAPTVLIYHSHATESYTRSPGEPYEESAAFRTLSEDYNMVSIGARVTELLEAGGINVIHDRTLHDYPSYNTSYNSSRDALAQYLEEYPSIRLVLDLHRDASGDNDNQMTTSATVDGKNSAQLMLVVATGTSARPVPDWQENLSVGLKLHVQLERLAPGICRYVNLRSSRFNQDLSPGALLIEVGAAGNTHPEALLAAETLAKAILELAGGANEE